MNLNKYSTIDTFFDTTVNDFSLNNIKKGMANTLIIGKRGIGKTKLIKNLLEIYYNKNIIDECIIFTQFANKYNNITTKIYTQYDNLIIENILENQKNRIKKHNNYGSQAPNIALVFDNCPLDFSKNNCTFEYLFLHANFYNCTLIFTTQYLRILKPAFREQFNIIFFSNENNHNHLIDIYNFIEIIPNYEIFKNILKKSTFNYGFLTIDKINKLYGKYNTYFNNNFYIPTTNSTTDLTYNKLSKYSNKKNNLLQTKKLSNFDLFEKIINSNKIMIQKLSHNPNFNYKNIKILENIIDCNNQIINYFN